ncbi:MAG TPA: hypothetical protein VGH33_21300, partial [Isosphaeraceae bacterium]
GRQKATRPFRPAISPLVVIVRRTAGVHAIFMETSVHFHSLVKKQSLRARTDADCFASTMGIG